MEMRVKAYSTGAFGGMLYGVLTDSLAVLVLACTLLLLVVFDHPRCRCRADHTEGTP